MHAQLGFSLVELSIVLVILGLLTGGILGGQQLIRAAEMRAVTSEHESWVTASHTFRSKYMALPGDMRNATQFWGRADNGTFSGQCASPTSDTGTGTQTCNGDGNGFINYKGATPNETFRFWQHLANAGLIAGTYTGVAGPGGFLHHIYDENYPNSKTGNGGWFPASDDSHPGSPSVWPGNYGNYLFIGSPIADAHPFGPVFTPQELWNIDQKLDDGKPATGKVLSHDIVWCTTGSVPADSDAEYDVGDDRLLCSAWFAKSF